MTDDTITIQEWAEAEKRLIDACVADYLDQRQVSEAPDETYPLMGPYSGWNDWFVLFAESVVEEET